MKIQLSAALASLLILGSACSGSPAAPTSTSPSAAASTATASSTPTPQGIESLTAENFMEKVAGRFRSQSAAKLTWTVPGGMSFDGEVDLPRVTDKYRGTWTGDETPSEIVRLSREETYIKNSAYGPGWHPLKSNTSAEGSAIRAGISAANAALIVATMIMPPEKLEILEKGKVGSVDTTHVRAHLTNSKGAPSTVDYWLDEKFQIIRLDTDTTASPGKTVRGSAVFSYLDKSLELTKPA